MHYRELKKMLKAAFPTAVFCGHGNEQVWYRTRFGKMPTHVPKDPGWLKMDGVHKVPFISILLNSHGGVELDVVVFNYSLIKAFNSPEELIEKLKEYQK